MRSLAVLALIVALSGCADVTPAPTQEAAAPDDGPAWQTVPLAACRTGIVIFFVDFEAVEPFLPAGFYPRDAATIFRFEATTGKAGISATLSTCRESGLQQEPVRFYDLAILVEPPAMAGSRVSSLFDAYHLERYVGPGPLRQIMEDHRVPWHNASEILVDAGTGATYPEALEASVRYAGGTRFWMEGWSLTDLTMGEGVVRFWATDAQGTTTIDTQLAIDVRTGYGRCGWSPDSPLEAMVGPSGCGQAVSAAIADHQGDFNITRYPGAWPQ